MNLSKKQILLVSFMLFSLFFGAGNLIFPPFLGQMAGENTPIAIATFLLTAVVLPVLGVIVVAKFNGLEKLANRVSPKFAIIFTILIYVSIGPGLGIPRAASVPFEMAVAPYLPKGTSLGICMLLYSAVFFSIATWLALNPTKLVERIGKVLTPSLLILIIFLFVSFLVNGQVKVTDPQPSYAANPAVVGFLEGYNTMDAIAALNFGLVISLTIKNFGVKEDKSVMKYTTMCGIFAGTILSLIYLVLSYLGMSSSGVYPIHDNGAWTLRYIVHDLFGETGAILLIAIFTLACLTTCVGLITSISQYFSTLIKKVSYRQFVLMISVFAFVVCNQGLSTILNISVPVLNSIYPIAIVLVLLGLFDKHLKDNPYVYPVTVFFVGVVSIYFSLENLGISWAPLSGLFHKLPFYSMGIGWSLVALVCVFVSVLFNKLSTRQVSACEDIQTEDC